jgi:hypothetical protein
MSYRTEPPSKTVVWGCAAATALLLAGCDQLSPPPPATTSTQPATTTSTAAKKKPKKGPDLARMFTGMTGRSIVALPRIEIPGSGGVTIRIALDWRRKIRGNKVRLSWDIEGEVLIRTDLPKIEMSHIEAAAKEMEFTDLKWGKPVDGELGASRFPAKIAKGTGKFQTRDSVFYYFDVQLENKKRMLIVAGVKTRFKNTHEHLVDSLKSIRTKR